MTEFMAGFFSPFAMFSGFFRDHETDASPSISTAGFGLPYYLGGAVGLAALFASVVWLTKRVFAPILDIL